jgi:paraquat-inducible protein A
MAGARFGFANRPEQDTGELSQENLIACPVCGLVQRKKRPQARSIAICGRCGTPLREHKGHSLDRTLALSLAALILYVPANLYPILRMEWYGAYSENTVWQGCQKLFEDGQWPVAGIVFLASIMIPLLKLLGLFFLVASEKFHLARWQRQRTWIYRFIEVIGPWAMLDVFLLSILVALVKLGQWVTVLPGPGLLAFTAVVVLTILATTSFDPRFIWEET